MKFSQRWKVALWSQLCPPWPEAEGKGWATRLPTEDADDAQAANRKERANAKRTAATTGDEDGTEGDDRTQPTTAPATKRAGNRAQQPDTENAANERRPGDANA